MPSGPMALLVFGLCTLFGTSLSLISVSEKIFSGLLFQPINNLLFGKTPNKLTI
uniref:Uncharacterized protein n=1 Tax=Anguilla anguilla TaxID=7936 RepID=A0A0E9QG45_ANGAN